MAIKCRFFSLIYICLSISSVRVSLANERTIAFNQIDLSHADSLSRRHSMFLDEQWEYRLGSTGEWHPIKLPAPLRLQGNFTFRKYFTIDSNMVADSYKLLFQGIEGAKTIFLNKKIIASNHIGTAPFFCDLANEDIFVNEKNELLIELDSQIDYHQSIPLVVRNRGIPIASDGLFRPVILFSGQRPCITAMNIDYDDNYLSTTRQFRVRMGVKVEASDTFQVSLTSKNAGKATLKYAFQIFKSDQSEMPIYNSPILPFISRTLDETESAITVSLTEIKIWQPRAPQNYQIKARLIRGNQVIDQAMSYFAFNEFKSGLGQKSPDHKNQQLQIIEWVEDSKIRQLNGAALRKRIKEDVQSIYDLGANGVRVLGNAPDEYFLTFCDSLGLAVLLEVPLVNIPPALFEKPVIRQKAKASVEGLVQAYKSHPCVYAWGLGSGYNPADPRTQKFLQELVEVARIDQRPTYVGVRGKYKFQNSLPVDFRIVELRPEKMEEALKIKPQGSGILFQIITPIPVTTGDYRTGQQNQAFTIKRIVNELSQKEGIDGIVLSPFRDWQGDSPHLFWGPRSNTELFNAGLVDDANRRRMAYDVVKAAFGKSTMPEILPAETPPIDSSIFQIIGFGLIFVLLLFIKRDKRLKQYLHRVFVYPHGFYMDLNENRQVNAFLTGFIGLTAFITIATIATSVIFYLRNNSYFDELLTWYLPNATAKNQAINLIWRPGAMILLITAIFISLAILQSIIYKIAVIGQRRFLRFFQILAFVLWVPANFIFTLPLAVILFRMLEKWSFVHAATLYFLIIFIWFFFRSVRGMRVILQVSTFRAFLLQILFAAIIIFVLGSYFEQTHKVIAYADYYRGLLGF